MFEPHASKFRAFVLMLALSPFQAINAATFTVLNTADSGPGSLRQAVLDANGTAAADSIAFAIPGTGPHTITLQSALSITQPLVIDGLTQRARQNQPVFRRARR